MTEEHEGSQRSGNIGAELLQSFQLAYRLFLDSRVSPVYKLLLPLAAMLYFILPIDLLPDVVPFLGQLDDVAVLLLLTRLFIMLAPQDVVNSYKGGAEQAAGGSARAGARSTRSAGGRDDNVVDADFRVVNDA